MAKKFVFVVCVAIVGATAGVYAAFQLSPWPSALVIRHAFDKGGAEAAAAIAPLAPKGVPAERDVAYAPGDGDALMDVFAPAGAREPLPAIVWVHGGGFVAGSRSDLSGYLQILAARGFVTIAVGYSLAPEARFPTPVRQTNEALAYVEANAKRLGVDPGRIFLAGDSAGAEIAAQTALVLSDTNYAQEMGIEPGLARGSLRGLVLFCGPYDPGATNFAGPFGEFMRSVIWAYVGARDPADARVGRLSVTPHVTAAFPPAFVSVGNADPLAPQSVALAEALRARGVEVDSLFFPADRRPPLDHEYQMQVWTDAGRLALERAVAFLTAHAK